MWCSGIGSSRLPSDLNVSATLLQGSMPIHSEDLESDPLKHHQVQVVSIAPARRSARAFSSVSSYSRAGSESATIPAPDCSRSGPCFGSWRQVGPARISWFRDDEIPTHAYLYEPISSATSANNFF